MQKNMGSVIKGITELQKRVEKAQAEIAEAEFSGEAAGGLVKVRMTGKGELVRVDVDPSVLSEGAETVGDLVVVASRKAYENKEALAKQKLSGLTSGLLPLGFKIPGLG
jgi:nucleoid-associated protein EbfC